MIYTYLCKDCDIEFEVIKKASEIDKNEYCKAGHLAERLFRPGKVQLFGHKSQDSYYNHGLGQVVKDDKHAERIAKEKGLVPIGNEDIYKHIKGPEIKSYED